MRHSAALGRAFRCPLHNSLGDAVVNQAIKMIYCFRVSFGRKKLTNIDDCDIVEMLCNFGGPLIKSRMSRVRVS